MSGVHQVNELENNIVEVFGSHKELVNRDAVARSVNGKTRAVAVENFSPRRVGSYRVGGGVCGELFVLVPCYNLPVKKTHNEAEKYNGQDYHANMNASGEKTLFALFFLLFFIRKHDNHLFSAQKALVVAQAAE